MELKLRSNKNEHRQRTTMPKSMKHFLSQDKGFAHIVKKQMLKAINVTGEPPNGCTKNSRNDKRQRQRC
ncbi:MAG: hypothetical protein P8P45_08590 [Flavobacteriales bacterium]|nr:hypothetical protein [Flavobacteriales bacterium]